MTLDDARKWLFSQVFAKAVPCPCCGQTTKVHKRKITPEMASTLFEMYHYDSDHPNTWLHVHNHIKNRGWTDRDFHKFRFWDLIERKSGQRDDGNPHVGFYRITQFGRDFVEYKYSVARFVWTFRDTLLGRSDGIYAPLELTDIKKALTDKFRYDELMK